ncbi:hypothetical protein [Bacillus sp. EB01]|uniref:hypothetical protein n=1 Tax=Bacillus sp. EB01 TaxID=1347086 RepID=UPI0005C46E7C|nr:hypothetical protein [Bacillus sp. EB01]
MKKKGIMLFFTILIAAFLLLHSNPNTALRTKVFFMGYPIKAISTEITDDQFHNETNKEEYAKLNAKAYTLTNPPIERATQGELSNYLVKKIGFLYFAKHIGNL